MKSIADTSVQSLMFASRIFQDISSSVVSCVQRNVVSML